MTDPTPARTRRSRPPGRFPETVSFMAPRGYGERLHAAADREAPDEGRNAWIRSVLDRALLRSERKAEDAAEPAR